VLIRLRTTLKWTDQDPLDDDMANRFQHLIGVIWLAIELGRIDMHAEVSMLSQFQCAP